MLSSRVTPLFTQDSSFRMKLECDDLTSVTNHLLAKGKDEIPISMGYAIVSMLSLKPITSDAFLDAVYKTINLPRQSYVSLENMTVLMPTSSLSNVYACLTESVLQSKFGLMQLFLWNLLLLWVLPLLLILAPFWSSAQQTLQNMLILLAMPFSNRNRVCSTYLCFEWIGLFCITTVGSFFIYFDLLYPRSYIFDGASTIGNSGITSSSPGVYCATVFETAGPALLYVCTLLMIASFSASAISELADKGTKLMWLKGGKFDHVISLTDNSTGSVAMEFLKIMTEVVDVVKKESSKWRIIQVACCLITPLPYVASPFYARSLFGCPMLGNNTWDMILIISGNAINYGLAAIILGWLTSMWYLLWEKVRIGKHWMRLLEDVSESDVSEPAFDWTEENTVLGWGQLRILCTHYRLRDLKQCQGILTGVAVVFLLYLGMLFYSMFGGWQSNLNGRNVLFVSLYTVIVTGLFLFYPVIFMGVQANDLQDQALVLSKQLAWGLSYGQNIRASLLASSLADIIAVEPYHLKMLGIPVTRALLKSLGVLLVSSLSTVLIKYLSANGYI